MKTITSISGNELFNMTSLMSACKVTRERNNRLSVYGRAIIDGVEYDIHVNAYDENRNMGIYTLTGVRVGEITSYYDSDDKERLNISFYNDESLVSAVQLDDVENFTLTPVINFSLFIDEFDETIDFTAISVFAALEIANTYIEDELEGGYNSELGITYDLLVTICGVSFWWDYTHANYCFGKGRISIQDFAALCLGEKYAVAN